jgi:hypothetical protein
LSWREHSCHYGVIAVLITVSGRRSKCFMSLMGTFKAGLCPYFIVDTQVCISPDACPIPAT